jgi:hypothetical protein
MPLITSLRTDEARLELESVDELLLSADELFAMHRDGRTLIARHRHNRWMKEQGNPEAFVRLQIQGPLVVASSSEKRCLGPYLRFAMHDGVLYVEDRVFGFWDVQHRDWYIVDIGAHWKELRISFHPTD